MQIQLGERTHWPKFILSCKKLIGDFLSDVGLMSEKNSETEHVGCLRRTKLGQRAERDTRKGHNGGTKDKLMNGLHPTHLNNYLNIIPH